MVHTEGVEIIGVRIPLPQGGVPQPQGREPMPPYPPSFARRYLPPEGGTDETPPCWTEPMPLTPEGGMTRHDRCPSPLAEGTDAPLPPSFARRYLPPEGGTDETRPCRAEPMPLTPRLPPTMEPRSGS